MGQFARGGPGWQPAGRLSIGAQEPLLPHELQTDPLPELELVGAIADTAVIAAGPGIRVLSHLRKVYGPGRWRKMKAQAKAFALCIDNSGYLASLILGKVYRILPDPTAAKDDLVRIFDESGDDYPYHKNHFVFVDFPSGVKKKILALQGAA